MTATRLAVLAVLTAACVSALTAPPAAARPVGVSPVAELNIPEAACGIGCGALSNGGALIEGGKQLITGHVGGAISTLGGGVGGIVATASTAIGLAAIGAWIVGGAAAVLHETATALGATTTPQLQ